MSRKFNNKLINKNMGIDKIPDQSNFVDESIIKDLLGKLEGEVTVFLDVFDGKVDYDKDYIKSRIDSFILQFNQEIKKIEDITSGAVVVEESKKAKAGKIDIKAYKEKLEILEERIKDPRGYFMNK